MAVPTVITDLSTTIASNVPAGSESPASLDDYQRAHAGFIAQLYANTVAAPTVIVASATSTAIGAAISENVDISGTTTITSFDTVAEGINRKGRFTGALTLTHNATSLILPGTANITTAADDRYEARSLGSGNWIVTKYLYASGNAGLGANTFTGTQTLSGASVMGIADGTAAAPSLKFTAGGTQLGLYTAPSDWYHASNLYLGVASTGLPVVEIGNYGSGANGNIVLCGNSAEPYGGGITYSTSRGTNASPTIVVNGDELGWNEYNAYDGATYQQVGYISYTVDGTPGLGDMPSALNFYTTPDGSVTIALRMKIDQAGNILNVSTGGLGYGTGSGGTVTQATNRTTGVTLSKATGAITMFSAAGSTTAATFTVTNTVIGATDTVILSQKSGTNLYNLMVTAVAAGSFNITFRTTGGTATDAPVINFAIIRGVTA
ncbi:hypothetical protein UFOVP1470_27 [uncultured Caudovirales phage]|uniref:Uncharacterized protein n=1 Tax=uncultured Caudovirales phage TaxID=2100421 RepID=A0A6J5PM69_9CAUD|nr:hypothetical protein UFOVP939_52 [uncultured Caudovirales phage]CAB4178569.1 hypothetical protein UFOVP1018_25 [uncultured Caudovirales phage]CAB4184040.1 hypothetical protein UFOVP1105_26 [uncultured Caudovirales phage]CAB4202478.1 hypothetical protein UFOVP1372_16 [uncultured Caudovirales phage]CAB4215019.1 hypothetical protein UFOVP1470_27 [uncultured Caudovirales phage]